MTVRLHGITIETDRESERINLKLSMIMMVDNNVKLKVNMIVTCHFERVKINIKNKFKMVNPTHYT